MIYKIFFKLPNNQLNLLSKNGFNQYYRWKLKILWKIFIIRTRLFIPWWTADYMILRPWMKLETIQKSGANFTGNIINTTHHSHGMKALRVLPLRVVPARQPIIKGILLIECSWNWKKWFKNKECRFLIFEVLLTAKNTKEKIRKGRKENDLNKQKMGAVLWHWVIKGLLNFAAFAIHLCGLCVKTFHRDFS